MALVLTSHMSASFFSIVKREKERCGSEGESVCVFGGRGAGEVPNLVVTHCPSSHGERGVARTHRARGVQTMGACWLVAAPHKLNKRLIEFPTFHTGILHSTHSATTSGILETSEPIYY